VKPNDYIPDVRDGLTRLERVILFVLHETQREMKGRNVPSTMLYGRVLERIDVAEDEFRRALENVLKRGPTSGI
jgi:hypothetical protein